jgi:DNA-binding Xre family transcriptional regulator
MSKKDTQVVIRFNLDAILESRGLSQRQAADMTGISKNGISVLAGQPQQIQMTTLAKLCKGLGVTPADLFKVEDGK